MAQERGWQNERSVVVTDTLGRQVYVTAGITTRADGRVSVAIGIGDGPSAVLDLDQALKFSGNLIQMIADLVRITGRGSSS